MQRGGQRASLAWRAPQVEVLQKSSNRPAPCAVAARPTSESLGWGAIPAYAPLRQWRLALCRSARKAWGRGPRRRSRPCRRRRLSRPATAPSPAPPPPPRPRAAPCPAPLAIGNGLAANSSQHGIDTTAASMPSLASRPRASTARPTSEPVARMVTSRALPAVSARTYAPLAQRFSSVWAVRRFATDCRVSASNDGASPERTASSQHSAVSTPSAGRNTLRLGMARRLASCSTGWCVGPSSPRPMEFVRHDVYHALAHERGKADRWPAVVGEDQERAAVRDETAVQRHAVHGGGHAVLAHAVVDVAAGEALPRDHRLRLGPWCCWSR